jgi:predicted transcriptional regulator
MSKNEDSAKKVYSIRLPDDVALMLDKLCEKDNRNRSNMIEQLIITAAKKAKVK